MPRSGSYQAFLEERSSILEDIQQFLVIVLRYFSEMIDRFHIPPRTVVTENARLLTHSLYLVHRLYGYPSALQPSAGSVTVEKQAVRDMLNELRLNGNGRTFVEFCRMAERGESFWTITKPPDPALCELREPAHIFLQLVRDLFGNHRTTAKTEGRTFLASLPDMNHLKPTIWAEHTEMPNCFGVSLGVRSFVRPLFLYTKLCQLRKVENNHNKVNLTDVNAYEHLGRKRLKKPKPDNCSQYDKIKDPCISCQIFFSVYNDPEPPSHFNPFGNCAEYDVIRNNDLDLVLKRTHEVNRTIVRPWEDFEGACQEHFGAFNAFIQLLEKSKDSSTINEALMKQYHGKTSNAKVLKYKCVRRRTQYNDLNFELVTENSPQRKSGKKTTRFKRRKTS